MADKGLAEGVLGVESAISCSAFRTDPANCQRRDALGVGTMEDGVVSCTGWLNSRGRARLRERTIVSTG